MATHIQRIKRRSFFGILLVIVCAVNLGCNSLPEATFKLASDSRLPRWVKLPPGMTRASVSLTMNYFAMPWGRSAQFTLRDESEQMLKKENGKMRCKEPFQLKDQSLQSNSGYPLYEAIIVDGATEIIEHRKMEPLFYITDNTAVWKQYKLMNCG